MSHSTSQSPQIRHLSRSNKRLIIHQIYNDFTDLLTDICTYYYNCYCYYKILNCVPSLVNPPTHTQISSVNRLSSKMSFWLSACHTLWLYTEYLIKYHHHYHHHHRYHYYYYTNLFVTRAISALSSRLSAACAQ